MCLRLQLRSMKYSLKQNWEMKNQEVVEFVNAGNRMMLSEKIPKAIQDLLLQCRDQDPEKRPNFVAISKMVTQVYEAIN